MKPKQPKEDPILGAAGFIFQTPIRIQRRLPKHPYEQPGGVAGALGLGLLGKGGRASALGRIKAVVKQHPEVMVKVSGTTRSAAHIAKHLSYISRNGKLVLEDQDGVPRSDPADRKSLAEDWWNHRGAKRAGHAPRETVNMVLSMPVGTAPLAVLEAGRAFAAKQFGGQFEYVLVLHEPGTDPSKKPAPHPHVHLAVRATGLQGQRLNPNKQDLQLWREGFAEELRRRGVAAAATPRRSRGVVMKGQRQSSLHMGGRSRHNRWRVQQAVKTLQGYRPSSKEEPWRKATVERQQRVRSAWGTLARALDAEGYGVLAGQVRSFVADMPSPYELRQERLARQLAANPELLQVAKGALKPDNVQEQTPRGRRR